jgi:RNA polymerase sigma factor (sigma-70 family)
LAHYTVGREGADMATGLRRVVADLQQVGGGLTDRQLLTRFAAARDEAAFATLVRRHGPMVLGVCRRMLRDFHEAEDAFQATFLVLARKSASLLVADSLGCWLYGVAYRTALQASVTRARRRSRERPMKNMPHPQVAPPEARDWLALLDRELSRLPEKYRSAIVFCDLEGRPRRDAARQLGVPEGTLSSRLAAGRQMLARRLAGCGVGVAGVALAGALAQGSVSTALVNSTAQAAALVAAGHMAAVATPAAVLMKEVMKTMLLRKLRIVVGVVMVLAALGLGGVGYHAGAISATAQAAGPDTPQSELDALRKENELMKLNLLVVLEKVRAQEAELKSLRKDVAASNQKLQGLQLNTAPYIYLAMNNTNLVPYLNSGTVHQWNTLLNTTSVFPTNPPLWTPNLSTSYLWQLEAQSPGMRTPISDPVKDAENAVKALRDAKDKEAKRKAADALEKAMKKLREQLK